jgi:hypothetical protein
MKPREYCCCAIPLVNAGIYATLTEQFTLGILVGTLLVSTPSSRYRYQTRHISIILTLALLYSRWCSITNCDFMGIGHHSLCCCCSSSSRISRCSEGMSLGLVDLCLCEFAGVGKCNHIPQIPHFAYHGHVCRVFCCRRMDRLFRHSSRNSSVQMRDRIFPKRKWRCDLIRRPDSVQHIYVG